MTRRELRENLYIMLFRVEFHEKGDLDNQVELALEEMNGVSENNRKELIEKFNGIVEHISEIDGRIEQLSNGWTINRIAKADLTVLRLGIYEILFDENVPNNVAVNEAVELSKLYGGHKSSGFVNGILGSLVRELS